jgi:ABC-2 type transport system ATP-binding protein
MTMEASPAISIRNLAWRAGKAFAIENLSMTVPHGAIYGFLGPNGSGKTTTISLMLGMLPPAAGTIEVLGHAMPRDAHKALARIGYVPERLHLYTRLTVRESIEYHRAFYATFDDAEAERLRKRFRLRSEQKVAQLSKGEAGKLMMLLALSQNAELLVLDEPTDGLDPVIRREVLGALVEYVEAHKATVFVSSHLVHEQERICDWVGVMDGGRLIAELPMEEFRRGIKRLHVRNAPAIAAGSGASAAPFAILGSEARGEKDAEWVVRGWEPSMSQWFSQSGAEVKDVLDLDLEESFVELLRGARLSERQRDKEVA